MLPPSPLALLFAGALIAVQHVHGVRILMTNDDGFASANLRELYKLLKGAGHDVAVVAPVNDQSGQGGRAQYDTSPTLAFASEYGIIPAGAPSLGVDPTDSCVHYYNGTPAACVFAALDYVLSRPPHNWDAPPDLLVSGPNFGTNLGPFLFTVSGTIGATYAGVGRGLSGIAISASNPNTPYSASPERGLDAAKKVAEVAFDVVRGVIDNAAKQEPASRIFPLGYGLSVNLPPLNDNSSVDSTLHPPIIRTRLTPDAVTERAVFNESSGIFTYTNIGPAGLNVVYNGNPTLPAETDVVAHGGVSVSVFTIDYDAPDNSGTAEVSKLIPAEEDGTTHKSRRGEVATQSTGRSMRIAKDMRRATSPPRGERVGIQKSRYTT